MKFSERLSLSPQKALVALLALAIVGCDRPKGPTATTTAPATAVDAGKARILDKLERLAVGTEKRDCGPEAGRRIREVARLIREGGVSALGQRIYPFCAILRHMSYDPAGLDAVMVHYFSASTSIPTIEFIDAEGRVLAKTPVKQGSDLIGLELQQATALVYVTPSFLAPKTSADPAVLKAGNLDGYPLVRVEGFSKDTKLRLVSDDGTRSEAIPFIHWTEDEPAEGKSDAPATSPKD